MVTSISDTGLLTVAADETAATLTVTAASTVDTTKSGAATVTVISGGGSPTVTYVAVSPATASVVKGGTKQFDIQIVGEHNPPDTVTWSVTGNSGGAGTSVSSAGLLTVDSDETATTLTVMATSTVEPAKFGEATVTTFGSLQSWMAVSGGAAWGNYIYGIAYGGGTFVAGGAEGKAAYSADGATWTAVADTTFGTSNIYGIAYGNGKFVAVGANGKAATSTDGATWTAIADTTFSTEDSLRSVVYGGGTFVIGHSNGKAAYSTGGTTWWTAVAETTFGTRGVRGIAYGGASGSERFVAVGDTDKAAYFSNQE
jgi:hypothetical protein